MAQYVGAIDQGTTSSRFIVFDKAGTIVSSGQKEHEQIYPQARIRRARSAGDLAQHERGDPARPSPRKGLSPRDLAAIGITNQRETTLIWDKRTGKPLHNALVWQDTRVDAAVEEFARDGGHDRLRTKTGLPLASYFSGLKLRWLLDTVPGAREKAASGDVLFGTIDTWLVWNLTGGVDGGCHITDVTNASRTQLMNLQTLAWDEEILRLFDIPRACLPEISVVERGLWRGDRRSGRRADRRHPRRSAGGPRGAGLLPAGRGQEHLRHRLLHADEHRRDPLSFEMRPSHDGRLSLRARRRRSTRWKAPSPSPARWCNGCGTISA